MSITDCREAPPHQKVWNEEQCCSGMIRLEFPVTHLQFWSFFNVKIVDFVCCNLLTDDAMDTEVMEDVAPLKKQKVVERCKFWPVCKSGDECLYHHPTTQCK